MYDAIVVGAGPSGSHAARYLSQAGFDVLIVEEHDQVGEPVQCAGLVTPRTFEMLDFEPDRVARTEITGARIHPPSGDPIEIRSDDVETYATSRSAFDREIFSSAKRAGVKSLLGVRATAFDRDGDGVDVQLQGDDEAWTERARLVVGADGPGSIVARWFDLPRPREFLSCYGAQMTGIRVDPDTVEMYFGDKRAPNFFSWIAPTGETSGKAEVGVTDAKAPVKHYFERMEWDPASHPRLTGGEIESTIAGAIPIGPVERSFDDRVMIVGDAAAQTKPTTGGGIFTGLRCAEHLVQVAARALEADDLSADRLSAYQDAWETDVGRELRIGWKLRKAFLTLDDDEMDELFGILRDPEVRETVEEWGDIDHQSRVAKALIKQAPGLFKFAGAALKGALS